MMSNRGLAPKKGPKNSRNKITAEIGVLAVGATAAAIQSVGEGTQPQVKGIKPSNQPKEKPHELN